MKNNNYRPRLLDKTVQEYLNVLGAIVIEGPKWCGKTWTSTQHCQSELLLGDPKGNFQNKHLAELSPDLVLSGETPRLLDEWQEVPPLWDAVRAEVDRRNVPGQFILTGSSTPKRKGILHSGAGRIGRLQLRTMTLWESGNSTGSVSLSALCSGRFSPCAIPEPTLTQMAEHIVRGGWPGNLRSPLSQAAILPREYITALLENDFYRVDDTPRDVHKMHLLLKSLARNESTTASVRILKRDISENDSETVDEDTLAAYLDLFRRMFLLDNQLPFSPETRSSLRVKQAEKRHLADPSLACALLKLDIPSLLGDLETFGFLFEAMCERDLRVYAQIFGAELYHYQDYKNNEIDAVLELPDRRWYAIEIKLGAHQIDDAAQKLLQINYDIQSANGQPATGLMVLCGLVKAAYQRPDGVFVVPITALKD